MNTFEGLEHVSTTTDIKKKKIITMHGINPHNMQRQKAAPACKKNQGTTNVWQIANEIINSFLSVI